MSAKHENEMQNCHSQVRWNDELCSEDPIAALRSSFLRKVDLDSGSNFYAIVSVSFDIIFIVCWLVGDRAAENSHVLFK